MLREIARPTELGDHRPDGRPFRDRRFQPRDRGPHRAEPRPAAARRCAAFTRRAPGVGRRPSWSTQLRAPHRPVGAAARSRRPRSPNEVVSPPAGAVGRGDGFLLQIADRTGATVVSNDSFQEFHAEYEWLFEPGRLIGGKPVPGVGWIFSLRRPVRGIVSRKTTQKAKQEGARPRRGAGGDRRGDRRRAAPDRRSGGRRARSGRGAAASRTHRDNRSPRR